MRTNNYKWASQAATAVFIFVDFALSKGGWCAIFTWWCAELYHDMNAWLFDLGAFNYTLAHAENSSRRILEEPEMC